MRAKNKKRDCRALSPHTDHLKATKIYDTPGKLYPFRSPKCVIQLFLSPMVQCLSLKIRSERTMVYIEPWVIYNLILYNTISEE